MTSLQHYLHYLSYKLLTKFISAQQNKRHQHRVNRVNSRNDPKSSCQHHKHCTPGIKIIVIIIITQSLHNDATPTSKKSPKSN